MIRVSAATVMSHLFTMTLLASTVHAQSGHADITLGWMEVLAGTSTPVASPDGILEPGEAARFSISISFTPIGTLLPYFPPAGAMAPVAGFRRTGFGIVPTTSIGGSWDSLAFTSGFSGSLGFLLPDGSLAFSSVEQPVPTGGSFPIATNPLLNVWSANWNPSSYAPTQVTFLPNGVSGNYPYLFLFIGNDPNGIPQFGSVVVSSSWGPTVDVPIAPSPGGFVIAVVTLAGLSRRRRMTERTGAWGVH